MMKKQTIGVIVAGILLYLVSTGVSYLVFSHTATSRPKPPVSEITEAGSFVIDPSIPRTEECPLNGKLFTEQERDVWETRRPLGVMIENHAESRPQSGLSFADVVYEAVAEGGVPRFLAIFHCGSAAFDIGVGPVRSARTYYLDWVSEYDALYNHVGGAGQCNDPTVDERAKALCQIDQYAIKDLDQFSISFPTCFRNYDRLGHEVATEHTMVCFTDQLHELAAVRGWSNVDADGVAWDKNFIPWEFADDADADDRGNKTTISFTHWEGYESEYGVTWNYDASTNSYARVNGGEPHIDLETEEQLMAKNVVIQFMDETRGVDEHAHLLYDTIDTGDAIIFQNGQQIVGTWRKSSRNGRTRFFDKAGQEVAFVRGPIWIEVVPTGVDVTY